MNKSVKHRFIKKVRTLQISQLKAETYLADNEGYETDPKESAFCEEE